MNLEIASGNGSAAPLLVAIPNQSGSFPLKALFATALIACSSTSAQAATVGPLRMDSGSSGMLFTAREQDVSPSVSDALNEIRRRSGLTWGQLASIFEVSRRAIHSWANGATVRVAHVGLVTKLLDRVREFEGTPAFKVREHLLSLSTSLPVSQLSAIGEPPILVSDNTPFTHQLKPRPGKINLRRG